MRRFNTWLCRGVFEVCHICSFGLRTVGYHCILFNHRSLRSLSAAEGDGSVFYVHDLRSRHNCFSIFVFRDYLMMVRKSWCHLFRLSGEEFGCAGTSVKWERKCPTVSSMKTDISCGTKGEKARLLLIFSTNTILWFEKCSARGVRKVTLWTLFRLHFLIENHNDVQAAMR